MNTFKLQAISLLGYFLKKYCKMDININCVADSCTSKMNRRLRSPPLQSENLAWFQAFHVQSNEGNTSIHTHMIRVLPRDDYCRMLLVSPVSYLNLKNRCGMTALHLGALMNQPLKVRELLVAGGNPEITDANGYTPLHYACAYGYHSVVVALIKPFGPSEIKKMNKKVIRVPDLSRCTFITNNSGEVPLHLIAKYGHTKIMKLFIAYNLIGSY